MKRKVLLSCVLLYFVTVNAVYSQNECEQYILKVDSLIKADNLDISGKHKPDSLCENSLLDFTKGKGYLGDSTEYYIKRIFGHLARKGHSDIVRKRAVNELLFRNYAFDVRSSFDIKKEDFDEKARKRLATLLRKQYTQEEEELYLKHSSRFDRTDTTYITQLAHSVNKTYREAKDSIMQVLMDGYKKKLYGEGYSIQIPILIGWLNMRDYIPLLDSIQHVDGDVSVMLALARMGNKEYQEFFLNHKENNMYVNFYIGTQDLIAKYGNELYSEEKRVLLSGAPESTTAVPIVYKVILELQKGILNFPKLITTNNVFTQRGIDKLPPGVLEEARQWMKENKGNYIISPNFSPYFDNSTLKPYREK